MPLIQVFTSRPQLEPRAEGALLRELSQVLATQFEKPESWVMTCLVAGVSMTFAGESAPACFAAVKNVGPISKERAEALSAELSARLSRGLDVPSNRVYIEFTEATGRLWGWNGETFA